MKTIFWKISLVVSILCMTIGFIVSLHGVHDNNTNIVYIGLVIIGLTCGSWWIWVMIVIKDMYHITHTAVTGVSDIRDSIKEVKQLIDDYKNLVDR